MLSRLVLQDSPVKTCLSRPASQDSTNDDKTCTSILYKQWQDLYGNTLQTPSKNTVKTRPLRLACQDSIKTIYKHCQESPFKTQKKWQDWNVKTLQTPSTNTAKTGLSRLTRQDSNKQWQVLYIKTLQTSSTNNVKTHQSRLAYKTLKIMTRLLRQDSTNNDKTFMSRLYKHCQDSPVKTLETMKIIKHQDSTNIIYKYCPDLPVKTRPLKTCLSKLSNKMRKLVCQDSSNTI